MRFLTKTLASILAAVLCALAFATPAAASLTYTFTSGTDVAVTGSNYVAGGFLNLSLGFAPTPGTNLTVVNNTGLPFISGTFDGVPQGGTVPLTYNSTTYNYIANYYGGNGRSFVLQWPCVGLAAWGANGNGQLGNNSHGNSSVPVAVTTSGVLAGKTVVAIASGQIHCLALTSGGQVFAWGDNSHGQLGNGGTASSSVPTPVNINGALNNKIVIAVAAGQYHSLALTSEGQIFAWGENSSGQLGNSGTTNNWVPVAVTTAGTPMEGKTAVAIAAGQSHSLALTSDGQVLGWGDNSSYQLGNNSTINSFSTPVAVTTDGTPLAGKTVVAIAAGGFHSLALSSDGLPFAWGMNSKGQLGDSTTTYRRVPVAVVTGGTTFTVIAGGYLHSLGVTSDGTAYAWGYNFQGQLGTSGTANSPVPVTVNSGGVLSGKIVSIVAAGSNSDHSLALSADGLAYAWGLNTFGQLGNSGTTNSSAPVAVDTTGVIAAKTMLAIAGGDYHSVAMFASGGPPSVITQPACQMGTSFPNMTVLITAAATGDLAPTVQWQSATGVAGVFSNINTYFNPTATTGTLIITSPSPSGPAYRAVFTNLAGSCTTSPISVAPEISVPSNVIVNASGKDGATVTYSLTVNNPIKGTSLMFSYTPKSGSTFPIGTTRVYCTVTNGIGTSTASFTVTVMRTFGWFQEQYGLLDTDPTADPNHTGVCNLHAYAFGLDPAAPDRSQLPMMAVQNGYLQISYPRWKDASDLSYVVEVSDDLKTWNSGPTFTQPVSVTAIDTTRELAVERDLIPTSSAARRFIRVRIVK